MLLRSLPVGLLVFTVVIAAKVSSGRRLKPSCIPFLEAEEELARDMPRPLSGIMNLALHKRATQSSIYPHTLSSVAAKAVDGNFRSQSHTQRDAHETRREADLLTQSVIKPVAISNPLDCYRTHVDVKLFDSAHQSVMVESCESLLRAVYTFQFDSMAEARYVRVTLHRRNCLSLAEVKVLVTAIGEHFEENRLCHLKKKTTTSTITLVCKTCGLECKSQKEMMRAAEVLVVLRLSLPAQPTSVDLCVLPATIHVHQNKTCSSFHDLAAGSIDIAAMKGETENRQLIVRLKSSTAVVEESAASLAKINFSPLHHQNSAFSINKTSWQYWQVCYVDCKFTTKYRSSGGGWRPDPLLDPPDIGVALYKGLSQPLWVQLRVPRDAAPGLYTGHLVVTFNSTGLAPLILTVPVKLTVWNITVPTIRDAKFSTIFSFTYSHLGQYYGGNLTDDMKKKYFSFMAQQRIPGDTMYLSQLRPIEDYEILASQGAQWMNLIELNFAANPGTKISRDESYCRNYSQSQINRMMEVLVPRVAQMEKLGLFNRSYVSGFDESPAACEYGLRQLFGAVKSKWPSLRTVAVLNWDHMPIDLPVDVWVQIYYLYDASRAEAWLKAGKEQWWYHSIGPGGSKQLNTFIERPLIRTRLLFWLGAGNFGVSGWLYYAVNAWTSRDWAHPKRVIKRINNTAKTDWNPANYVWGLNKPFANGDGYFLYPGPEGPLPSVRLHNICDGLEDVELLRMLPEDKARNLVRQLVRSATDFATNPALMESTRRSAAEAVTAMLAG